MTVILRLLLLLISFLTFWFMIRKIRKSQMQIEDAIFWIGFSFIIFLLALFPGIGIFFANILGFDSAINFVFLSIIFVLLIKIFVQSIRISQMSNLLKKLAQCIAVDKYDDEKTNNRNEKKVKE